MIWGRAAGRCQSRGCNKELWKSPTTQEQVNIGQKAHIWSFSADGPRGNAGIDESSINDISNLLLLCHACHKTIDEDQDGVRYSPELLKAWKLEHESRVELVTGIQPQRTSHVVLYGANIGHHSSPLQFASAAQALFPDRYPAEDRPIDLGMVDSSWRDRHSEFWKIEGNHLRTQYQRRVGDRLARGEIEHISVFALAPQPLLILLGSLLTDIPSAEVFQLRREPKGWGWEADERPIEFIVTEPSAVSGPPALVLSLSATITNERIQRVLGTNAAIWTIGLKTPHNDFLQSRRQLQEFRQLMRQLLNRIKAKHGNDSVLHVFPAAPVAIAVELGRVHMPKADMRFRVYDEIPEKGFVHALDIPSENEK